MATARVSLSSKPLLAGPWRVVRAQRGARTVCMAKPDEWSRKARIATIGLVAATLPIGVAASALAVEIEIFDDRGSQAFHRSMDQARDDGANYKTERFFLRNTDGLSLDDHMNRAKESYARLQKDVKAAVDSKTYYKIENDIRHQMGYLRYDLNTLVASLPDGKKQQAVVAKNKALRALEELDLSVKLRKDAKLAGAHAEAVRALGDAMSYLA